MRPLMIAALTACGLLACSTPTEPPTPAVEAEATPLSGGPVEVLDSGWWSRTLGCSGICVVEYNFWVDIAVRNDGFNKQVGVMWTKDNWATHETAYANYEEPLEGNFERWGVDVRAGQFVYDRPEEFEYAVFATIEGYTHWEPHNNHYIINRVTPAEPVRRLNSEVHYEPQAGGVMTGTIRVFDLAFEKEVVVRYSTDGWETFQEAPAEWLEAEDWSFRIEGLGGADGLPEEVVYAVVYRVNGEEFWDNNNGGDYRHTLAPKFTSKRLWGGLDESISGILSVTGSFETNMPNEGIEARVDEGAWQEGRTLVFSTLDLTDGPHQVEFRLNLEGGFHTTGVVPFLVDNVIEPVDGWEPPALNADGTTIPDNVRSAEAWDMARDPEGRLYLLRDDIVAPEGQRGSRAVRYAAYGADAELIFDPIPEQLRASAIAVNAQGVYMVTTRREGRMCRFNHDGSLDAGFGASGCVSLDETYAGEEICYAGDLAASPTSLYLADTCNERILRFGLDGAFIGAADLPDDSAIPGALFHNGTQLWVAQAESLTAFTDAAGGLSLVEELPVSGVRFNGISGLTHTHGRFWVMTGAGGAGLYALSEDAEVEAVWYSDDYSDLLGSVHLPQALLTLNGGDLVTVGAQGCQLPRFSGILQN